MAGETAAPALVVRVEGIRNQRGLVQLALFRSAEGYPEQTEKALRTASIRADNSVLAVRLEGLSPGVWALAVLHDENENQRLDRNFLGIPREGMAHRIGPPGVPVRPSSTTPGFVLPPQGASLVIALRYWL
jgi:uncharacterized protein (DUF2141 family)